MRHVSNEERRARFAVRHALAPGHRMADPTSATRAMVALHATEPPTVHLSLAARVEGYSVEQGESALYATRTLVKQLAMRRTLFVFPTDLMAAVWGSASARVAQQQGARIAKDAVHGGLTTDGTQWLAECETQVLAHLANGGATTSALREQVPILDASVSAVRKPGSAWGGPVPVGPRVLTWLGARGLIVRGHNDGHWRVSRPLWTRMADWLGDVPEPLAPETAYAELVRRWLGTFGPGTTRDIQWWLGSTVGVVRRALADLDAVQVALDDGGTGWLLPDDLDEPAAVEPWATLLPVLDPTTMGWKERGFHLDPAAAQQLFDRNGNAGTTAWWNGRIVGCWVQDEAGTVRVIGCRPLPRAARAALEVEADRLTAWLGGVVIRSVYSSPLMKSEAGR